jgi:hypothetical protein
MMPASGADMRAFLAHAREGWRLVLVTAAAVFMAALIALWLVKPRYTAAMAVSPTSASGVAGMGIRMPAMPGDLGIPPIIQGDGEALSDFVRFQQLAISPLIASQLAAVDGLLPAIFPEMWDARTQDWHPPLGPGSLARTVLRVLAGHAAWAAPDGRRLARHVKDGLTITQVEATPMRRISYRHSDRDFAITLLKKLYEATDAHLRAEARRRTIAQLDYIRHRLGTVTVTEHRNTLIELQSRHERNLMMIEVDLPFAADLIEPPDAPTLPDWPDPVTVLPLAAAAGMALGMALVYVRKAWRETAA